MKRWMQKLISLLMSLALVLSLGATAFANETDLTPEELAEQEEVEHRRLLEFEEELKRQQAAAEAASKVVAEQTTDQNDSDLNNVKENNVEENNVEENNVEENNVEENNVEENNVEENNVEENNVEKNNVEENNVEENNVEENNVEENDIEKKETEENSFEAGTLSYVPSMFLKDLKAGETVTVLGAEPSGTKSDPTPTEYIETGKTEITMDGEELDGTNDDGSIHDLHWQWKSVDGTLSILDHNIDELIVKEGDLTIQAAGFNRINSLVSNSVVNIIGTGILLLDDYDLKDSGVVKLTENTMYEDTGVVGSVAVFLKDKEASEENTYKLINGSIPALLDAAGGDPANTFGYEIQSGYHLVLPSGTSLIMNSFVTPPMVDVQYEYHSGLNFDPDSISGEYSNENAASLKIASGASLTVEKGASIEMISTNSKAVPYGILTPKIEVVDGGKLGIEGLFKGFGQISGNDSDISGIDPSTETVINVVGSKVVGMITTLEGDPFNKQAGEEVSFEELKAAWKKMYSDYDVSTIESFVIVVNGKTVEVKKDGSVKFPATADEWGKIPINPVTGIGIAASAIAATGNGILEETWDFPSGGSKVILTAAKENKENLWRVIVTENPKRGTWTLSVWYGDVQIFDLGVTTVRARFEFDKPDDWNTKNIYAVFLDKNGDLRAFPAKYYATTGELVFDSNLVGEFVIVNFDYKGELYSRDFYDKLAKLDEVKHLVDLHSGKAE